MTASVCGLCDQIRECIPREIDGQEYDICSECWDALAEKLRGKGRKPKLEVLITSPPDVPRHEPDEKPFPGVPPKVWLSDSHN
jgi:hypothetical protein